MRSRLPRYFVAPDARGDVWLWREDGDYPVPIFTQRSLRDDPELWDAIVALVEGAS